jgi:cation diffusion facilitator CzcD-associated flavoprotein CzcO
MAPDTPSVLTPVTYSRFACIGAGFSGIGLGATLKRWYGITDIRIFERHDHVGGTWYANRYPGAGCDIPSALYSLSYESNPDWSRVLPPADELREYLVGVAEKYDLLTRTTLGTEVVRCEWVEGMAGESKEEARGGRWKMTLRNVKTGEVFFHECQFLFSGAGQLVKPRDLDIPGAASFKGRIIHSACMRGKNEDGSYQGIDDNGNKVDIEIKNKKIIVIGNGCTGTQIVPTIVPEASHVTHLSRSKHWLVPCTDSKNLPIMRFMLRWIPGAMLFQRILIALIAERFIKAYPLTEAGQRFRDSQRVVLERYMRKKAPEKYHDQLIPEFEVGCKRRVFDTGYLECLHGDGVTLTNEKALEIVPEGIRTAKGVIEADLIILAIGFQTNSPLHGIEIVGRGGKTLGRHWDSFGGPGAYNCTIMNGFPNFFLLLG